MASKFCIGIIAATMPEAKMLVHLPDIRVGEVITIPGTEILLIISGMGKEAAEYAFQNLSKHRLSALISWGTACSLVHELQAGQIILPKNILTQDLRLCCVEPMLHQQVVLALEEQLSIETRDLIQTDKILTTPQQRGFLAQSGAIAADMESFTLGELAKSKEIPYIAIRCIIDELDSQLPQCCIQAVDNNGVVKLSTLLSELIKRPQECSDLLSMFKKYYIAKRRLRKVWQLVYRHLKSNKQLAA